MVLYFEGRVAEVGRGVTGGGESRSASEMKIRGRLRSALHLFFSLEMIPCGGALLRD
jgi:hypothetical protein